MKVPTRGRSVRIYLAAGEVTGIRHAEVLGWTGQALACPRARLGELKEWTAEVERPGVYFLVGPEVEDGRPEVYIGESEDVLARLRSHDAEKDFWQEVVIFSAKDSTLTKTHVKYLEHRLFAIADQVDRRTRVNSGGSKAYTLPRADKDAMEDFLDNLRVLLGALGHRFLVPRIAVVGASSPVVAGPVVLPGSAIDLRYSVRGAEAVGVVTDEGFLVRAGSRALTDTRPSMGSGNLALKQRLQTDGTLVPADGLLRFARDHLFTTPSQAAAVIYGNSVNGRLAWKDGEGRTLRDIEEKALGGPAPAEESVISEP